VPRLSRLWVKKSGVKAKNSPDTTFFNPQRGWGMINLNTAFTQTAPVNAFPNLTSREIIPSNVKSRHNGKSTGQLGLGVARAIARVLTHDIQIEVQGNGKQILIEYRTSAADGQIKRLCIDFETNLKGWTSEGKGFGATAPYLLALVECLWERDEANEVYQGWWSLLRVLEANGVKGTPFFDTNKVAQISGIPTVRETMLHLCDALYFHTKAVRTERGVGLGALPDLSNDDSVQLFEAPKKQTSLPSGGHQHRLERLAAFGGTALLVGPTGTFKTETAKRVALEGGAALVVVKGRPGLEDRDFFGGVVPTPDGPRFIDGPLSQAYRRAQTRKTVLIVDELMRFESYHLAALVGALDSVSPSELEAMGLTPILQERHRVLELPTGERLAAPVSQLTIFATTNLGDDYSQAGGQLDAALLGRFNLTLEFNYAPDHISLGIYTQIAGKTLAEVVLAVEHWTRENTAAKGGLLQREANPRVVIAWLEEALRCIGGGMPEHAALIDAAQVTIMPFCVARDGTGQLDFGAVRLFVDFLEGRK
jgi:MoxR-like ATPase